MSEIEDHIITRLRRERDEACAEVERERAAVVRWLLEQADDWGLLEARDLASAIEGGEHREEE